MVTALEQSAMYLTPPQVDGLLRDVVTTHLRKLERIAAAAPPDRLRPLRQIAIDVGPKAARKVIVIDEDGAQIQVLVVDTSSLSLRKTFELALPEHLSSKVYSSGTPAAPVLTAGTIAAIWNRLSAACLPFAPARWPWRPGRLRLAGSLGPTYTRATRWQRETFALKYSVQELLSEDVGRWDKRIAADLAKELEGLLHEKADTIPEIRRLLAVKGYREMRLRIQKDTLGFRGDDAIRAMAVSMRAFAHERPGLSAATFKSPVIDTPVWRREGELLQAAALAVFEEAGLSGEQGVTALRILRAIVRGYVLHEMASSFLDGVDYDATYDLTIKVFIRGLDEIRSPSAASDILTS